MEYLTLCLSALNVLVLPALIGAGRWLMKIEMRLMRLEMRIGLDEQKTANRN